MTLARTSLALTNPYSDGALIDDPVPHGSAQQCERQRAAVRTAASSSVKRSQCCKACPVNQRPGLRDASVWQRQLEQGHPPMTSPQARKTRHAPHRVLAHDNGTAFQPCDNGSSWPRKSDLAGKEVKQPNIKQCPLKSIAIKTACCMMSRCVPAVVMVDAAGKVSPDSLPHNNSCICNTSAAWCRFRLNDLI